MGMVRHQAVSEDGVATNPPELRQELDATPAEVEVRENRLLLQSTEGHEEHPTLLAVEIPVLESEPLASPFGHDSVPLW
jgi:hypothetical protein